MHYTPHPPRGLALAVSLIGLGVTLVAPAPQTSAAPADSTCGTVVDVPGRTQPVVVLRGDVDCATAIRIANRYFHDSSVPKGDGSDGQATVEGWQCRVPVLPGRAHADSYAECDLGGNGFRIGN